MRWLPVLQDRSAVKVEHEERVDTSPVVLQAKELAKIGDALTSISTWLTNGGLTNVLSGYARSQSVKDILGGLAAHGGRSALDARVIEQNATEIVHHVEAVFKKYEERLSALAKGNMDEEMKDGEKAYKEWKESK